MLFRVWLRKRNSKMRGENNLGVDVSRGKLKGEVVAHYYPENTPQQQSSHAGRWGWWLHRRSKLSLGSRRSSSLWKKEVEVYGSIRATEIGCDIREGPLMGYSWVEEPDVVWLVIPVVGLRCGITEERLTSAHIGIVFCVGELMMANVVFMLPDEAAAT